MKRAQVTHEWELAAEALQAAEVLCEKRLPMSAVSRAYYAIEHAAKAALAAKFRTPAAGGHPEG